MKIIIISFLIITLFFLAFLAVGIYLPAKKVSESEQFLVEKGEGAKEIALSLEEKEIIRWSFPFRLYVLLKGTGGKLKAGEYSLSKSMNVPTIADKFFKGGVLKNKITIIEGWNLRDIAFYLEERGLFSAEQFFEKAGYPGTDYLKTDLSDNFISRFDFLKNKPSNISLEGFLFPDTYEIHPSASLEEVIGKILKNFDDKFNPELRSKAEKQGRTLFEVLTMASLIEKEVRTFEDKKIVSGVLWKRLEHGVPLQVDSTIIYLTGKKSVKVSREETKIDSPFNTYKYKGLPLGPICNPGLDSIKAALSPEESFFWYYLSTPEGETVFSRTLEEHNGAKAEHLK